MVYRYYGSYRPEPVILTERVLSKTGGNRLEIAVEWKSGKETRSWKQFVTDTQYNRDNDVVDRLVLSDNGKETELPNKDNLDLFKLYEGAYLIPQHSPVLSGEVEQLVTVGRDKFPCRVRTYKTKVRNRHAVMTVTDSKEFKWTNVSRYYKTQQGGLIYAMEVVGYGNR